MIKRFFSFILALIVIFSFEANSFALTNSTPTNKIPNMVEEVNKQIDYNNLKNVKVEKISLNEQNEIQNFINSKQEMVNLNKKLKKDGFKEISYNGDKVLRIIGGNYSSILYYVMNAYENNKNEKVITLTIFSEDTNQILITYSEKLDKNFSNSVYDISYNKYNFNQVRPYNATMYPTAEFDVKAFLCGMTGTVACSAFSAMLFAFVPASIAVGMTCAAAFNYVCSIH